MLAVIAWALQSRVKSAWHWAVVGGLLASLVTALPLGVMLASYLLTTALALLFRYRLWHLTVLSMLIVTFAGTLITHLLSIGALLINDVPLPILDAFNLVTLPSLLLNLLLAIPVYIVLTDLAAWAYPEEIEV
jgi:cell shape-determining protein MreD